MRSCNSGHGQNGDEILDSPVIGDKWPLGKKNHANDEYQREEHREFELYNILVNDFALNNHRD